MARNIFSRFRAFPDQAQRAIEPLSSEHRHILSFESARLYEESGDFIPPPFGHLRDVLK